MDENIPVKPFLILIMLLLLIVSCGENFLDNISPTIEILGVENEGLYVTNITPIINIQDEGSFTCSIKLNGEDFVSGTEISDQGGYTLAVEAKDNYNNISSLSISFTIDKVPQISKVTSSVFSKTGEKYITGSMVKIEVEENNQSTDIARGTIRIISLSQGYDSGIQNLFFGETIFYHWDTAGISSDTDYIAEIELVDDRGQVGQNSSLGITLAPNPPTEMELVSHLDLTLPSRGLSPRIIRTYRLDSGFNDALGYGWTHTYLMHVVETVDGLVKIFNPDGSGSFFKPKEDGTYESPKGDFRRLIKNIDRSFVLREKSGRVFNFDEFGKLISIYNKNENALKFFYDDDYRIESIIDPSGQIIAFNYDENNRLSSVMDYAGRTVSYEYDLNGDLISFFDIGGFKTIYTYDENHNLRAITDPAGHNTFFTINDEDQLIKRVDEGGNNSLSYEYNTTLPEVIIIDGLGNKTTLYYDNNGLVNAFKDPLGNIMHMTYDEQFNLLCLTDANGKQTIFTYDHQGNMLTKKDPKGQITYFSYEPVFSKVTNITDASGNTTIFEYDSHGNLVTMIYPDGSEEQYAYDAFSNMITKSDRMNWIITFEYDDQGKMIKKSFPDGTYHTFTYDSIGNMITAEDENGTLSFSYDSSDRLILATYPNGETLQYEYNPLGDLFRLTYPDGTVLEHKYDKANRLTHIDTVGQTIASYTYDLTSKISRRDLQNGVYTTYSHDANRRLLSLINYKPNSEVISSFSYTYDQMGNRLSMTTEQGSTQYIYDELSQLIKVIPPSSLATDFVYDTVGNRTSVIENGDGVTYSTNNLNQYTEVGGETYTYDTNGNMTSKTNSSGTTTYTYDFENHLIRVDTPSETISYAYDPFGRRISKTTSSNKLKYIHDGYRVVMEKDEINVVQAKYIYGIGIDEILVMERNGTQYYYCHDGLGSVSDLTDLTGNKIESYSYDAFGKPENISSEGNPYLYTGREYEPETGLYYYRARYYDPILGRFLSPDPIGFEGGLNFYTYVENNSVNLVDPTGKWLWFVELLVEAAVLAIECFLVPHLLNEDEPFQDSTGATREWDGPLTNSIRGAIGRDKREIPMPNGGGGTGIRGYREVSCGDPTFIQTLEKDINNTNRIDKVKNGLIAKIFVPSEDSLVRANVPICGVAYGESFKEYRVEYGEGKEPSEWITITTSSTQQTKDMTLKDLDDSSDQTIHGNLATWDTGLKNYVYGDEYPPDHPIDLNGTYTVRLIVSNTQGEVVEDKVTVEVGRVIPNIYGGIAISSDGMVLLAIPEQAIRDSFRVISIKPIEDGELVFLQDLKPVGGVYEFRPTGERFTKNASLEINLPDHCLTVQNLERFGIFAYNINTKKWEHFPSTTDRDNGKLITMLRGFPDFLSFFAILENSSSENNQTISSFWVDAPKENKLNFSKVDSVNEDFFIYNTFEDVLDGWTNRDGDVGATLRKSRWTSEDGSYCLQISNSNEGGNFASTITNIPFDAEKYSIVQFEYKVPKDVKINLLVKVDDRWYDIEFTDDPKQYRRLNMEKIGAIEGVVNDNEWHVAQFNLKKMLKDHPPLQGKDEFIIQEMIMADWDAEGYMKLVYGKNKKGAKYYIDNFMIKKDSAYTGKDQQLAGSVPIMTGNTSDVTKLLSPSLPFTPDDLNPELGKIELNGDSLLVEDFQTQCNLQGHGLFSKEDSEVKIFSSIDIDEVSNFFLRIDFDVTKVDNYAGYYRLLNDFNLNQYNTLCFWIRGEKGNEIIRVGLKSGHGQEDKVVINTYLEEGITKKWQKVSIPLQAFPSITDFSSMENISFLIENNLGSGSGTIFLDNIYFEKDITPLVVANYSNLPGRNIWGKNNYTYNTSKAQMNIHYDKFGCLIHYDDIVCNKSEESWAVWRVDLNNVDASKYSLVSFKFKGIHGTERPNLYLDNGIEGVRKQFVDFERYLQPSGDWQVVNIPLKDFSDLGVDLTHLAGLIFAFEWEQMSGAFYIDDITFEYANEMAQFAYKLAE